MSTQRTNVSQELKKIYANLIANPPKKPSGQREAAYDAAFSVSGGNVSVTGTLTAGDVSTTGTVTAQTLVLTGHVTGVAVLKDGKKTVNTPCVGSNSLIYLSRDGAYSGTGILSVTTKVDGTSFDIQSTDSSDSGFVNWLIINI